MVRAFLRAVVFAAVVFGVALFLLATLDFAAFLGLAAGDDALSFLTLGWVGRLPATCRPFAAALLKTLLTVFFWVVALGFLAALPVKRPKNQGLRPRKRPLAKF